MRCGYGFVLHFNEICGCFFPSMRPFLLFQWETTKTKKPYFKNRGKKEEYRRLTVYKLLWDKKRRQEIKETPKVRVFHSPFAPTNRQTDRQRTLNSDGFCFTAPQNVIFGFCFPKFDLFFTHIHLSIYWVFFFFILLLSVFTFSSIFCVWFLFSSADQVVKSPSRSPLPQIQSFPSKCKWFLSLSCSIFFR